MVYYLTYSITNMVSIITSIALPLDLFEEIDSRRGKVSRSKYCLNLMQIGLDKVRKERNE